MKHTHVHDRIDHVISNTDLIVKAIQDGARAALNRHRQAGVPVVVSKNGKMVVVQVEDLVNEKKHHGAHILDKANQRRIRRKKLLTKNKNLVKGSQLHMESIEIA